MKKQKIVIVIFLLLLFVNTEVRSAQGVECGDLVVEGHYIEIEFMLMKEDLKTLSEHDFNEPFPEGDYLVIKDITVTNKPGIYHESQNISNTSLKIYVHPVGSEMSKIAIARLDIPPLNTNDSYGVTYSCGQYESNLNGEVIERKQFQIYPVKLSMDGWWQIDVKFEPLTMYIDPPAVGYTTFGYTTIINGEQRNYFFRVYSDLEITALKIAEKNLETARWNLRFAIASIGVVGLIGVVTIGIQMYLAKKQKERTKEITDALKGIARGIIKYVNGKTK